MQIVRLAKSSDRSQIFNLIKNGDAGMTTLPKSEDEVLKRIQWSQKSLKKRESKPAKDCYFFVLEEKKKIVGISAIYTSVSKNGSSIFFKKKKKKLRSKSLNFSKDIDVIQLHRVNKPYTELGTLFLHPNFRGKGRGSLLSLARFKFMALWPERFDKKVFAEIRGKVDKDDQSIFWKYFSRHFYNEDVFDNDKISYIDNSFISESIPRHPFLISPLNKKAQLIIGKPNDSAFPAFKMMESQNFKPNGLVDIIDAGPCLDCSLENIKIIKTNKVIKVQSFGMPKKEFTGLVSNTSRKDFRVVRSSYSIDIDRINLHRSLLRDLNLNQKSKVAINA